MSKLPVPLSIFPAYIGKFIRSFLGTVRPLGGAYYLARGTSGTRLVHEFMRGEGWQEGREYILCMATSAIEGLGGQYYHVGTGYRLKQQYGHFLCITSPEHARLFDDHFVGLVPVKPDEMRYAINGNLTPTIEGTTDPSSDLTEGTL